MIKASSTCRPKSLSLIGAVVLTLFATPQVYGQPAGCSLAPDDKNPSEKILRCGDSLIIRNAPDTRYELTGQDEQQKIGEVRLDSGALLLEFTPSDRQKQFQILTPHAIAAVRGTKWAVEVVPDRTSTLVVSGTVEVKRPMRRRGVLLHAGEGTDVSARGGRLAVKRWAQRRVDALLARFGQ